METGKTFTYQYSAENREEIASIRSKYLPREESKLERLKRLDSKAENAGQLESLILGIIGALIFGVGMCFGIDALVGAEWLAFLFGGIGTLLMLPAYPLYKSIARKTRSKLTPEILRLSDEIIGK